ncbi:MAG: AAA family ATPase, partial [Anaerolineaceae bacterium]|nr:AAA family ATPase [Anaerolineaceae bacterium]
VYVVRGIRPRVFLASQAAHWNAQMVGREKELSFLIRQYEKTIARRTVVAVGLKSEVGVGKTRLMDEFIRRLRVEGKPFILFHGRADPGKNHSPHALLRDLLASRFKLMESDTPSEARDKLVSGVEEWIGLEVFETAHWLGYLAGYGFSNSPFLLDQLNNPRRSRQQALNSLCRFISAAAAHTPLVIIIDDMQWADESSVDGLEALLQAGVPGPVFILAAFRPEMLSQHSGWVRKCRSVVELQPLPLRHSTALTYLSLRTGLGFENSRKSTGSLNSLLGQTISQIIQNSDGNPLLIKEIVQTILGRSGLQSRTSNLSRGKDFPWKANMKGYDLSSIPSNLAEVFHIRLANISQNERKVLQAAAVVGEVFWESTVFYIIEREGEEAGPEHGRMEEQSSSFDISRVIDALLLKGILFRREISTFNQSDEYVFISDKLCETVYASLTLRQRMQYHLYTAKWLVDAGNARVSETQRESLAPVIALHYEKAGKYIESSSWFTRAAYQALNTLAPDAASTFYHRALDLLPQEPGYYTNRVHLLKELWNLHWWMGKHLAALECARNLLWLAKERSDYASQAAALNRIATIQNQQGDYQEALTTVQQAERLARPVKAAHEVVMALFN